MPPRCVKLYIVLVARLIIQGYFKNAQLILYKVGTAFANDPANEPHN